MEYQDPGGNVHFLLIGYPLDGALGPVDVVHRSEKGDLEPAIIVGYSGTCCRLLRIQMGKG